MNAIRILVCTAAILCLYPGQARAAAERFALLIGQNRGAAHEAELRYAENDANKVYDVLRQLGGFRAENTTLIRGTDAHGARRALRDMERRVREHVAAGGTAPLLLVYYSGHADAHDLHLADTRLGLRELEQTLAGSSAALRIMVLDSCRSGALTRVKGGHAAAPVRIHMPQPGDGSTGTIFMTASAAGEDAQESDQLAGSFFTHYLVSGLLGAADGDGDGRILLNEAYDYAYQHTLRASSSTLVGTQHPTFRHDVRGRAPVVLTQVRRAHDRAIVHLPRDRTYLLFEGGRTGPVIAEVGRHDSTRRISVPPGRYFVRARTRDYLLEGAVMLVGGRAQTVSDNTLRRIDYARLIRKGMTETRAVHGPRAGLRSRSGLFAAGSCSGPYLGYAVQTRRLTVVPRVEYCGPAAFAPPADSNREAMLSLRLTREWDLSRVTLGAGLTPGVALLGDASEVVDSAFGPLRAVAVLGAHAAATVELMGSSYAVLDLGAQAYIQQKQTLIFDASSTFRDPPKEVIDELDVDLVLNLSIGMGVRF